MSVRTVMSVIIRRINAYDVEWWMLLHAFFNKTQDSECQHAMGSVDWYICAIQIDEPCEWDECDECDEKVYEGLITEKVEKR